MQLRIERRAEVALRSLEKIEQRHISRSLNELLASDRATLTRSPKIHILSANQSGRKLFVYRGSPKLRLVLSFENETCVLEDIVDHDRLGKVIGREGQE
jgi:hypothetical protein